MRKFRINVNGNSYEVEVEEIGGAAQASAPVAAAAPVAAPAAAPAPVKAAAPAPVAGNGTKVTSPLPGTVQKLVVANGATVKTNDVILIIEAMKMENEIRATANGKITFAVAQGASVDSGAVLAYIA